MYLISTIIIVNVEVTIYGLAGPPAKYQSCVCHCWAGSIFYEMNLQPMKKKSVTLLRIHVPNTKDQKKKNRPKHYLKYLFSLANKSLLFLPSLQIYGNEGTLCIIHIYA